MIVFTRIQLLAALIQKTSNNEILPALSSKSPSNTITKIQSLFSKFDPCSNFFPICPCSCCRCCCDDANPSFHNISTIYLKEFCTLVVIPILPITHSLQLLYLFLIPIALFLNHHSTNSRRFFWT